MLQATKEVNDDIKVMAVCGSVGEGIEELYEVGFDGIFGTIASMSNYETVIKDTTKNVARVSEAVARLIK